MLDWRDIEVKEQLRKRYLSYIHSLQEIAKKSGYALALHGSVQRDIDLVAVPWVKRPHKPETLVMRLEKALTGHAHTRDYWKKHAAKDKKPHRRKAYIIFFANLSDRFENPKLRHAIIDLSVIEPSE